MLLWLAVFAAPLALGGVHTATAAAVSSVLFFGVLALLVSTNDRIHMSPVAVFTAVGALWCGLQVVPIPAGLLEILSPGSSELFVDGWQAVFPSTAVPELWRPISVNPSETMDRAMRWLALLFASVLAANLPSRKRAWQRFAVFFVLSGVVVLAVGVAQRATGATTFLWWYEAAREPVLSTFVSPNHAGAFYGLMALVGFFGAGRAIRRGDRRIGTFALIAAAAFVVGMGASNSLSVLILFLLSVPLLALSILWRRRSLEKWKAGEIKVSRETLAKLVIGVLLLATVIVPPLLFFADALQTTGTGTASFRFDLVRSSLLASLDFWLAGSGAGSVESILPSYVDWSGRRSVRIPTVENEPAEWFLTMGWPVAVAMLVILVGLFLNAVPRKRERSRITRFRLFFGAIGLFVAGLSLLHFPFYTLGISIPAVVLLESLFSRTRHGLDDSPLRRLFSSDLSLGRKGASGAAILMGLLLAGALAAHYHLFESASRPLVDTPEGTALRRHVRWKPADGDLFLATAIAARDAGDYELALRRARRANELSPLPHVQGYLAYLLAVTGRQEEAVAIYVELFATVPEKRLRKRFRKDVLRYIRRPEAIATIATEIGEKHWDQFMRHLLAARNSLAATEFVLALVDEKPNNPAAYRLLVELFRRTKEFELAEFWARAFVSKELTDERGRGPLGYDLVVRTLFWQNRYEDALEAAREGQRAAPNEPRLNRLILSTHLRKLQEGLFTEREIRRAMDAVCNPPQRDEDLEVCWRTESWLADRAGDEEEAMESLRHIMLRLENPLPLAEWFERHGKCLELRSLKAKWSKDESKEGRTLKKKLHGLYERCISAD